MKKHAWEILFVVFVIVFVGGVAYVFKTQNPSAIPPQYKLTSQAPVVSVDERGQIFVRTDCAIEEYRNCIGQLASEIIALRKAQQPKAETPAVK